MFKTKAALAFCRYSPRGPNPMLLVQEPGEQVGGSPFTACFNTPATCCAVNWNIVILESSFPCGLGLKDLSYNERSNFQEQDQGGFSPLL